jgi:D-threo-aldose 1-dehydrogenase
MHQTTIPGTSLRTSRFILGTAQLFSSRFTARTERYLEAAVELGFTHFDTAPIYGFGFAERALAPLLSRHKHLTVTTKAGLYAPGGSKQGELQILARKVIGRVIPAVSRFEVDFAVSRAKASLSASLARLGREHVELFLIHEPNLAVMNTDEWLKWLLKEKQAGRVGDFGVAGTPGRISPFLRGNSDLASVVQVPDSLDRREADVLSSAHRALQITYGYVRSGCNTASVKKILIRALLRNSKGAIIVSTRRVERLSQYREALAAADTLKCAP